ncbi:uncharacterized protein LOC115068088 [Nannospalax galili]|uniref:uncharacterized protein LOC115068088 n=1 Tax=Nannospalax galili TaxID=1026970 RepID=UPI00111C4767|nr:uncharacterized protein LOC115068088 [Nannospalax galili]
MRTRASRPGAGGGTRGAKPPEPVGLRTPRSSAGLGRGSALGARGPRGGGRRPAAGGRPASAWENTLPALARLTQRCRDGVHPGLAAVLEADAKMVLQVLSLHTAEVKDRPSAM